MESQHHHSQPRKIDSKREGFVSLSTIRVVYAEQDVTSLRNNTFFIYLGTVIHHFDDDDYYLSAALGAAGVRY